jgi:hypothetical protein
MIKHSVCYDCAYKLLTFIFLRQLSTNKDATQEVAVEEAAFYFLFGALYSFSLSSPSLSLSRSFVRLTKQSTWPEKQQ